MDINKTIEILEALASGCSPTTGEVFDSDSVFNERSVIRALQIAVDQLKNKAQSSNSEIEINKEDMKNVIELFKEQNRRLTSNSLVGFFRGTRKFKNENLVTNQLYGKYHNQYQMGQLLDYFTKYLSDNNLVNKKSRRPNPYKVIDFFRNETFNDLSKNAINQLKEKVDEIGIKKTKNISEYVQVARIEHPRAYESWTRKEKELLSKAIKYTNDLDLLSICFQRGKGAIESCGQRIIYELQDL